MINTTINNFQKNFLDYINQAIMFSETVNIVTDNGNAVLVSEEDWKGIQETLYLHSIPGLVENILEASKERTEDMVVCDPDEEW